MKGEGAAAQQVRLAAEDGYKRLLSLAMETESRLALKERADREAIRVFAANLRELLLAPPLGGKNVLAIDPGFRTGCKVVCLDRQGKLLHTGVVYPHSRRRGRTDEAAAKIRDWCERFAVEAIAIGNGTAGRETEAFVRGLGLPAAVPVVMVNESGASIYSASEVAREEFPDQDLTVRGAVSIGRRLMDPLAELVKIDPKSIGVGQYQHDVDQNALKASLDTVVTSCVNQVGVELNTASAQLLSFVSGLGPSLARNIVAHRDAHGPFAARADLLKVPRLGPKAFEQAAGFLRIRGGANPLDASAVHPESYPVVERMAGDLGCAVADLLRDDGLRKRIDPARYVDERVGLPTLTDILAELERPGRDPREQFEAFSFAEGVDKIEDLAAGHEAPRDRHQRHGVRRLRGHRRAPGRARARQPARRPLRQGPGRGGQGAAAGAGDGAGRWTCRASASRCRCASRHCKRTGLACARRRGLSLRSCVCAACPSRCPGLEGSKLACGSNNEPASLRDSHRSLRWA